MTSLFRPWQTLLVLFLLIVQPALAQDETFPKPEELRPDVDFWISVFTRTSTDEGLLHDNRHMGVVYEIMPMPANTGRRTRNRRVKARREHYKAVLATLASGKRDNLSAEEYRVLELWPNDVSNDTLRQAAGRIRFQHGLKERFREGLIRSGQWRAHVDAEFSRLGVPIELAALPHVESSYNPKARSHVGASGIWQFTRSTGRRFMQVDHVLDERNDPFLATTAAARLLAYNYSIVGNWPMAITAYNHGLSGVRRAMRAYGDTEYVDILRNYNGRTFGFASRNFYVAFLAAKEVDQNPHKYFPGVVPDKPIDYALYRLDDYVPADSLSGALGISERDLARYNPATQATIWQGSKYIPRDYEVRVPAHLLGAPMSELIAAIPDDQLFARQLPDLYHTIARGDTLSEIAAEYDTRVSTLVALNGLGSSNRIRAGQRLRLPAAGPLPAAAVAAVEPVSAPAEAAVVDIPAIADAPALAATPEMRAVDAVADTDTAVLLAESTESPDLDPIESSLISDPSDYSVAENLTIEIQPMETLGHYADWLGIKTQRLRDINGFAFRAPVAVGQRIKLEFKDTNVGAFENLRTTYHQQLQDTYFRNHTITGVREHQVGRGESVWILSLRQYDTPIWLFRQYNPSLDLHKVYPGVRLNFPVVVANEKS